MLLNQLQHREKRTFSSSFIIHYHYIHFSKSSTTVHYHWSVSYWSHTGPTLVPYWANAGPILGQHWTHTGPTLVPYWANTGPILGQHWSHTGPTLVPHWANTGPTLPSSGHRDAGTHVHIQAYKFLFSEDFRTQTSFWQTAQWTWLTNVV